MNSDIGNEMCAINKLWEKEISKKFIQLYVALAIYSIFILAVSATVNWLFVVLLIIPFAIITGGLDNSYARYFLLLKKGFLPTVDNFINISTNGDSIIINFFDISTTLHYDQIQAIEYIYDDTWVGVNGIEDVLIIRHTNGIFKVPKNADGFDELYESLKQRYTISQKPFI